MRDAAPGRDLYAEFPYQSSRESRRAAHRNLLPEDGPNRQLKSIPTAGDPQSRAGLHSSGKHGAS